MVASQKVHPSPSLWRKMVRHRYIYLLALPMVLYFFIFKLGPMFGLILAFKDYNAVKGIMGSPWVGMKHFHELVTSRSFPMIVRNTIGINSLSLVLYFPLPILLAVMLSEVRHDAFKRINQSILYLPHFMSWVVITSLTIFLLATDVGLYNKLRVSMGLEQVSILTNPRAFWLIVIIQNIWKDAGWGTILFLAALTNVDQQLYEAAVVDGATRMQQIMRITLPCIMPTITVLLILRIGKMFQVSLEQIQLLQNSLVRNVSEVFDTYAYNMGLKRNQIGTGVAVGMFQGVLNLIFVVAANRIVRRLGQEGIY